MGLWNQCEGEEVSRRGLPLLEGLWSGVFVMTEGEISSGSAFCSEVPWTTEDRGGSVFEFKELLRDCVV